MEEKNLEVVVEFEFLVSLEDAPKDEIFFSINTLKMFRMKALILVFGQIQFWG